MWLEVKGQREWLWIGERRKRGEGLVQNSNSTWTGQQKMQPIFSVTLQQQGRLPLTWDYRNSFQCSEDPECSKCLEIAYFNRLGQQPAGSNYSYLVKHQQQKKWQDNCRLSTAHCLLVKLSMENRTETARYIYFLLVFFTVMCAVSMSPHQETPEDFEKLIWCQSMC